MKKIIIALALLIGAMPTPTISAQNYTKEGKQFVQQKTATASTERETGYTWKDTKGKVYPIFMGKTGSCYIKRTSAKTGSEYRQYLGAEISAEICAALGVEYKPKTKAN